LNERRQWREHAATAARARVRVRVLFLRGIDGDTNGGQINDITGEIVVVAIISGSGYMFIYGFSVAALEKCTVQRGERWEGCNS
jgi:hypothetical protein